MTVRSILRRWCGPPCSPPTPGPPAKSAPNPGVVRPRDVDRGPGKLSPHQEAHLVELHRAGQHTTTELAELFNVARSTVYRAIRRAGIEPSATD